MSWDYRAVQFGDELCICAIRYDKEGTPLSYAYNAMATGSDFNELRQTLNAMATALDKPKLRATDFPDAPRNGVN